MLVVIISSSRDPIAKTSLPDNRPGNCPEHRWPHQTNFPTTRHCSPRHKPADEEPSRRLKSQSPPNPYFTAPSPSDLRHSSTPTASTRHRARILDPARRIVARISKHALNSLGPAHPRIRTARAAAHPPWHHAARVEWRRWVVVPGVRRARRRDQRGMTGWRARAMGCRRWARWEGKGGGGQAGVLAPAWLINCRLAQ